MDVKVEGVEGQIGTKGILLRIAEPNGGGAIGRLHVGKATLRWYPGKTSKNCKQVSMEKFVEWLNSN
jgi:hypothetical protein